MHNLYLHFSDHLVDSSLIGLTLQETYRHIGLALHANLSFDLSFDMKNHEHWLGLQTLGKGIPVSSEALPLWNIVTAFRRSSEDLLFIILLVALCLMADSNNMAFLSYLLILKTFCLCWLSSIYTLT